MPKRNNKKNFAKIIRLGVAKGSLLSAAMEAIEEIWDAAAKGDPSSTNDTGLQIIQACNKAGAIIGLILVAGWRTKLTANYDDRNKIPLEYRVKNLRNRL
jgi:hypothetical protein